MILIKKRADPKVVIRNSCLVLPKYKMKLKRRPKRKLKMNHKVRLKMSFKMRWQRAVDP